MAASKIHRDYSTNTAATFHRFHREIQIFFKTSIDSHVEKN